MLLSSEPARRIASKRRSGSRIVLGYHNIISPGTERAGDGRLHLSLDCLRFQLDALQRSDIRIAALNDPLPSPEAGPEAVITFDDACAGAIELAVPELAARDLPGTVFVAPGLLGSPAPWWDRLATEVDGAVPDVIRNIALNEYQGVDSRVLFAAADKGWAVTQTRPHFRIATEAELAAALLLHPKLAFGSHSWSHANLAALDPHALEAELQESLEWLTARWPTRTIPWIAYPYGLESPEVRAAVARLGYIGALRISGGWQRSGSSNAFAAPRLHVSSLLTRRGFVARTSGLYPA